MITDACSAAGVELGAYDERIIGWLASFEPQVCAVFAGLIVRASEVNPRLTEVNPKLTSNSPEGI